MPDQTISSQQTVNNNASQAQIDQIVADAEKSRKEFYDSLKDDIDQRLGQTPVSTGAQSANDSTNKSDDKKQSGPDVKTSSIDQVPTQKVPPAPTQKDEPVQEPPREFIAGKIKGEQWKALHKLRDEAMERATKAEKELERLKSNTSITENPETKKQLESLQSEYDKVLRQLESIAVERSPRFEAQFKPRFDAAIQMAKSAVGPDYAEKIAGILSLPDSEFKNQQVEEIAGQLSGIKQIKFANALAEVDKIMLEKSMMSEKSHELFKQWQNEHQLAVKKESEAATASIDKAFEEEMKEWAGVDYFKLGQDESQNAKSRERISRAREIFSSGLPLRDLARASLWSVIGPDAVADSMAKSKKIQELEEALSSYKKTEPGSASDATTGIPPSQSDDDDTIGYADAISRSVRREGLMR